MMLVEGRVGILSSAYLFSFASADWHINVSSSKHKQLLSCASFYAVGFIQVRGQGPL